MYISYKHIKEQKNILILKICFEKLVNYNIHARAPVFVCVFSCVILRVENSLKYYTELKQLLCLEHIVIKTLVYILLQSNGFQRRK